MSSTVEERLNKMQSAIAVVQDTRKTMVKNEGGPKIHTDEAKTSITILFPWVTEFRKMCRCIHVDKSMTSLTELMHFYVRNVSISVNECYTRPLRAARLKDSISETLLFFLYIYRELSEDHDRSTYLNNMSDLLALYVDMELKASRKSKEDHDKICARLTSCLYVYLEHSTEHLLDTLMKMQFMCRSYHHILDPLITKIIKSIPEHPETNIMYVRYLLIYRLWRKVNGDVAVKNQITTAAIASLGPPPPTFPPCILEDVLPKVPKCQPNSTKTLLQHKFDIKKCCELFVQFCRETSGNICPEKDGTGKPNDSSTRVSSQMLEDIASKSIDHVDNNVNSIIPDKNKQNESISLPNNSKSLNLEEQTSFKRLGTFSNSISTKHAIHKSIKSNKNLLRRKSKKSNEIVIIDLTSDIAFEKCIKKKKSIKLPWLEEAKKRVDIKMVKASQKIKKKKQEKVGQTHLTNNSKSTDHQSEDISGFTQSTENIKSRSSSVTCSVVEVKENENQLQTDELVMHCSENKKKISDLKVNHKESEMGDSCSLSSALTVEPLLTDGLSLAVEVSNVPDVVVNGNCYDNSDYNLSEIKADENVNDRFNKQTVIKRLIETDTFSENETRERAESLKKICDLETETSKTVGNTVVSTQCNSKDDTDNFNCSNRNVNKQNLSQRVTSSIAVMECEQSNQNTLNNDTLDNIGLSENFYILDESHETSDSEMKYTEPVTIKNETNRDETMVRAEIWKNGEISNNGSVKYEKQKSSYISIETSVTGNAFEAQEESKLSRHGLINGNGNLETEKNVSDIQTVPDVANYVEIHEDTRETKSNNADIRESIFESYSMDKNNISSAFKEITCPQENNESKEPITYTNKDSKKSVENLINNPSENDYCKNVEKLDGNNAEQNNTRTNLPCGSEEIPDSVLNKSSKRTCDKLYKTQEKFISGNKYIVQDSELQDSIDGLSLLASVSQHIPHLKAEFVVKCDQIKVKDYASLRYACCNQGMDDDTDTNDSSNTVSQLLENPSTDIINRIVGVYPEDALEKVALHVEVTSSEPDVGNVDNELNNIVPHSETSLNYDPEALAHNGVSVENTVQPTKESTNVILNGETVVLLQKSPNSNLYIINKAVENSKDPSDDELSRLKEKSWLAPQEECGQFEVISSSDHTGFNLELAQYGKELSYQENKYTIGRNKGIKVEPEDGNLTNLAETKSYAKKKALSTDVLPVNSQIYQDVNAKSKSIEKRKTPKSNLGFRQNIKQEFANLPNHVASNCAIQGCNGIHSHTHDVDAQHPLHIPVTRPATLPSIYTNCAGSTDLCVPYHKHCTSVSCSLQINATTSLHSHTNSGSSCGRSHCSCLNCTYDIVTHCRQCIHPATDTHVSCIESNPYFLPTHSSVQTPAVQEHDRTKSEAVIGKLYDDQLLCKIEQSLLQNNSLEKLDAKCESEKLYKKEMDNKLPLKKRLKAHAMMSSAYEDVPIKTEKLDNYPSIPMMSIAALEVIDNMQKRSAQMVKSEYELPSAKRDDACGSYHCNSNLVRRDYYKDIHVANSHHNIAKESTRKHERQFRSANDQSGNTVCQESYLQRTFKTPAQRKEINVSGGTSLKRFGAESMGQGGPYKKPKKTQLPLRQTRSSKRNVPKVNYCYTDVDPEWNPSGESKRKRKKTSR